MTDNVAKDTRGNRLGVVRPTDVALALRIIREMESKYPKPTAAQFQDRLLQAQTYKFGGLLSALARKDNGVEVRDLLATDGETVIDRFQHGDTVIDYDTFARGLRTAGEAEPKPGDELDFRRS